MGNLSNWRLLQMTEKQFNSRRRQVRETLSRFTQVSLHTKAILLPKSIKLTVLRIDCPCSHSKYLLGVILILSTQPYRKLLGLNFSLKALHHFCPSGCHKQLPHQLIPRASVLILMSLLSCASQALPNPPWESV